MIHCKWLNEITVRVAYFGKRKTWADSSCKPEFSGILKSKQMACMEINFHGLQGLQILRDTEPGSPCNTTFLRAIGFDVSEKVAAMNKTW